MFEVGDVVFVDCCLIEVLNLEVDEVLLIGEVVFFLKIV